MLEVNRMRCGNRFVCRMMGVKRSCCSYMFAVRLGEVDATLPIPLRNEAGTKCTQTCIGESWVFQVNSNQYNSQMLAHARASERKPEYEELRTR